MLNRMEYRFQFISISLWFLSFATFYIKPSFIKLFYKHTEGVVSPNHQTTSHEFTPNHGFLPTIVGFNLCNQRVIHTAIEWDECDIQSLLYPIIQFGMVFSSAATRGHSH
ncbi:hypothetical protein HanHA89_Chr17g0726231 [Helianthus annuus]|nr:hypothetical protein HanHA89_Chr17g0726231 [Helianthus annuus]